MKMRYVACKHSGKQNNNKLNSESKWKRYNEKHGYEIKNTNEQYKRKDRHYINKNAITGKNLYVRE